MVFLSEAFYDAIYLFSCGARGEKPVLSHDINLFKIYNIAVSQGIWQIIFLALKGLYDKDELIVDKNVFDNWHNKILSQAIQVTQRSIAVGDAIHELEQKGIQCCVLKGEAIADLYYAPICRISGDTDILISGSLESQAVDTLKHCGFEVKSRYPTSHHVLCYHAIAGLIELHLHLYDELFEDVWFDKKALNIEEFRRIKTSQGNCITTLGINDGLIYVTLHFIKHFLSKGAGIRQLMDVLLYISHHKDIIDWNRYNELLKYLKYDKFIDHMIGIGKEHLGFNENELPQSKYNNNIVQKILLDMEKGGIFGDNEIERKDFYKLYTKERFNRFKQGSYEHYMNEWMKPSVIKSLFPNKISMSIKYPYVMKNELFLFVAWMQRFGDNLLDVIKKKKEIKKYTKYQNTDSNDIINKRMDLIRELDMI